jgi:hypothetical protein
MYEWVYPILLQLLNWIIPFSLGLLFRKRVARFLITTKKRLFNDIVTINLLSVRSYNPTKNSDFGREMYEDTGKKLPRAELLDVFSNVIRVKVPVFVILKLSVDKILSEEVTEQEEEAVESVKMTLSPESPVRLGIREVHLLDDYGHYVEMLFDATEKSLETVKLKQNYTLIEVPRIGHFKEEKTFEYQDEILGASVQATPSKVTIVVDSSIQIAKATRKYLLT